MQILYFRAFYVGGGGRFPGLLAPLAPEPGLPGRARGRPGRGPPGRVRPGRARALRGRGRSSAGGGTVAVEVAADLGGLLVLGGLLLGRAVDRGRLVRGLGRLRDLDRLVDCGGVAFGDTCCGESAFDDDDVERPFTVWWEGGELWSGVDSLVDDGVCVLERPGPCVGGRCLPDVFPRPLRCLPLFTSPGRGMLRGLGLGGGPADWSLGLGTGALSSGGEPGSGGTICGGDPSNWVLDGTDGSSARVDVPLCVAPGTCRPDDWGAGVSVAGGCLLSTPLRFIRGRGSGRRSKGRGRPVRPDAGLRASNEATGSLNKLSVNDSSPGPTNVAASCTGDDL